MDGSTQPAAAAVIDAVPAPMPAAVTPRSMYHPRGPITKGRAVTAPKTIPGPPIQASQIVETLLQTYAAVGKSATASQYARHVRRFLLWLEGKGWTVETMPESAAAEYLREREHTTVNANMGRTAIALAVRIARDRGLNATLQDIPRFEYGSKVPPQVTNKRGNSVQTPTVAENPFGVHTPKNGVGATPLGQLPPDMAAASGPIAASPQPQPAPPLPLPQPTPQPKPPPPVGLPSLGGRFRLWKRCAGYENFSQAVGTLVLIGDYGQDVLLGEGSVVQWIHSAIRPYYGPFIGQPPGMYYTDRIDNVGNAVKGSLTPYAITPDLSPGAPMAPPWPVGAAPLPPQPQANAPLASAAPTFGASVAPAAPSAPIAQVAPVPVAVAPAQSAPSAPVTSPGAGDQVLQYALDRVAQVERNRDELQSKVLEDLKKRAEDPMAPSGFAGVPLSSVVPAAPVVVDPLGSTPTVIEALMRHVTALTQKVTELASRPQPVAPPAPAQQSPIDLMGAMLGAMAKFSEMMRPPPPPEDPVKNELIRAALSRLSEPAPKGKTLGELLAEFTEFRKAQELFNGPPPDKVGLAEVLIEAVQNADKFGPIVAALAQARALGGLARPVAQQAQVTVVPPAAPAPAALPASQQSLAPEGQPAAADGAQAQSPAPANALSPEIIQAYKAIEAADPADAQGIVMNLYAILAGYAAGAEPLQKFATAIVEAFKKARVKSHVAWVVDKLFKQGGAKSIARPEILAKVTDAVAANYSMIYSALTGGESKSLEPEAAPVAGAPAAAESVSTSGGGNANAGARADAGARVGTGAGAERDPDPNEIEEDADEGEEDGDAEESTEGAIA